MDLMFKILSYQSAEVSSCIVHWFSAFWLVVTLGTVFIFNFYLAGKFHRRVFDIVFLGILLAGNIVFTCIINCQLCLIFCILDWCFLGLGVIVYEIITDLGPRMKK